ncbi:protein of unknown function [Chitinophaga jiangningensis]|uniref:DUF4349 domain-containing protein n=1 Tax=Chitinophaga jiangningensis TaxID=1419482 RepID=A0A1M6WCR1_9BACT|nr:DUF4349 domain-containing protein [Chitinophaga jiangningensis]SHK91448.1 protein of unknown function [Chitinophaga jiangningensis]
MTFIHRKDVKRLLLLFAGIFVLMFCLRLWYGYQFKSVTLYNEENPVESFDFGGRRNYASEKFSKGESPKAVALEAIAPDAGSQKYEKIARLKTKSLHYSKDEERIYQLIDSSQSIIQFENKTGNAGKRKLQLLIGVIPEKFDSFYIAAQRVGVIVERNVTKTDKTNEYSKLNAQKISLQKTLASLNELKHSPGKIEDFIALHDKIYAIETELQNLGVELGSFDTVNEFCTVQIYMYEGTVVPENVIHFSTRMVRALEWTVKYYGFFVISAGFVLGSIYCLLAIREFLSRLFKK